MCFLGYTTSTLEAEGKALLAVVQSSVCLGYKSVILESDCEVLIKSLWTLNGDFRISTICSDIEQWCMRLENFEYRHVHREANALTHELAKRVTKTHPFSSSSCFIPY